VRECGGFGWTGRGKGASRLWELSASNSPRTKGYASLGNATLALVGRSELLASGANRARDRFGPLGPTSAGSFLTIHRPDTPLIPGQTGHLHRWPDLRPTTIRITADHHAPLFPGLFNRSHVSAAATQLSQRLAPISGSRHSSHRPTSSTNHAGFICANGPRS
jgi:hypothetical protein